MNPYLKPFLILAAVAFFIGADWQTEIAWINLNNGWEFAWVCQLWKMTNWQALDLFRLFRYIIVLGLALQSINQSIKQ